MSGFETIIFEKKGNIAYVTLNRPKVLNVFSVRMRDELYQVLSAVSDDDEIYVVVFQGAGEKAFCAGADLSEFLSAPAPVTARRVRFHRDLWDLFLKVPQPLIAALHGFVLGSGLEIALCCDLRIASPDVRFGVPELKLGIIPAAGGTQTLPRAVGWAKALEMLLTNRWVDGEEALRAGLINQLVPREELLPVAEALAQKIASFDQKAVKFIKQAVNRGMDLPLAEGMSLEKNLSNRLKAARKHNE